MRDRLIRGGMIDSDRVNKLTWAGEVFYRRLQQVADDFGRMDARENILRTSMYPLKLNQVCEADVVKWMDECSNAGLVSRYEVGQKRYLEIINFGQRMKFPKQKYPPPEINTNFTGSEEKRRDIEEEVEVETEERENVRTRVNVFKIFLKKMPEKYPDYDSKVQIEFQKLNREINEKEQGLTGDALKKLQNYYNEKIKILHGKRKKIIQEESDKFFDHYEAHEWKHKDGSPINNMPASVNNWLNRIKDFQKNKAAAK